MNQLFSGRRIENLNRLVQIFNLDLLTGIKLQIIWSCTPDFPEFANNFPYYPLYGYGFNTVAVGAGLVGIKVAPAWLYEKSDLVSQPAVLLMKALISAKGVTIKDL